MKQIIGKSMTKHYMLMVFELQSRTDSPHPFMISWKISNSTMVS